MIEKLTPQQREIDLEKLLSAGWEVVDGRDAIRRSFKFENFNQAFGWMTQVAMQAEKIDHHPEWSNVYNSVDVVLSTHSVGGLSFLDIKLAHFMDKIANKETCQGYSYAAD